MRGTRHDAEAFPLETHLMRHLYKRLPVSCCMRAEEQRREVQWIVRGHGGPVWTPICGAPDEHGSSIMETDEDT